MKIATSNPKKVAEFKEILGDSITSVKGQDLPEVKGTIDEVILHKAKDAGTDLIVEDTILARIDADGNIIEEIVDIRWKLDVLIEGESIRWITSLGYNDGETITVYRGEIDGVITKQRGSEGFAFDPYFVPTEFAYRIGDAKYPVTLADFDALGRKKEFSARFKALMNLKNGTFIFKTPISDILPWEGEYQH